MLGFVLYSVIFFLFGPGLFALRALAFRAVNVKGRNHIKNISVMSVYIPTCVHSITHTSALNGSI